MAFESILCLTEKSIILSNLAVTQAEMKLGLAQKGEVNYFLYII